MPSYPSFFRPKNPANLAIQIITVLMGGTILGELDFCVYNNIAIATPIIIFSLR